MVVSKLKTATKHGKVPRRYSVRLWTTRGLLDGQVARATWHCLWITTRFVVSARRETTKIGMTAPRILGTTSRLPKFVNQAQLRQTSL